MPAPKAVSSLPCFVGGACSAFASPAAMDGRGFATFVGRDEPDFACVFFRREDRLEVRCRFF